MPGVLESVLKGDVFFGDLLGQVGAHGVCVYWCWRRGGRDGCLAGGRAVVGVLEDSCDAIVG